MSVVNSHTLPRLLIAGSLFVSANFAAVSASANEAQRAAEAAMAAATEIEFTESELAELEGTGARAIEEDYTEDSYADESDSDEGYSDEGYSYEGEDLSYSSDPVRVETSMDFLGEMRMNYVTIRAKEDLVVLHGLTINRGNCGYTLSGRMDAPFPVNIRFGNGAKYLIKCHTVLEVTVRTNYGEHTYTFGQ